MDKNTAKKKKLTADEQENAVAEGICKGGLDPRVAGKKIQHFFILSAWRHEKEKGKQLEVDVKSLTNLVESLHLQIYTLKHLLDAEKNRVIHFNSDLRKILSSLEECNHEKHSLMKEKEQLEIRLRLTEEKLAGVEMDCKNQQNELITAKSEALNWEKQLEKEREKLLKMKDERKSFMEEVRFKGNLLVWQIRSFEQFSRFFNILQIKPNNPALPWEESLGRTDPETETFHAQMSQKKQQTVVIVEKSLENSELKAFPAKVGRKIAEEDGRIEELEKSILGKTWVLLKNYYRKI